MADTPAPAPAPVVAATGIAADIAADVAKAKADIAALKLDYASTKVKVEAFVNKQSTWLAAHAHAVVTGVLCVAVAYLAHLVL
jgi:predicted neutral ceramidase superfamily lipid hydrolase